MYIDIWDGVKRNKSNQLFLCDAFYKSTWFLEILKVKNDSFYSTIFIKVLKVKSDKKKWIVLKLFLWVCVHRTLKVIVNDQHC